jgi:hypothetical protein
MVEILGYSTISFNTVQRTKPKPFFIKHPIAKDLQCAQMYGNGSKEYIQNWILPNKNVNYAKSRIQYQDEKDLKTDCDSINNRSYFPVKPRTDFEAKFPLAFVRIVYIVSYSGGYAKKLTPNFRTTSSSKWS